VYLSVYGLANFFHYFPKEVDRVDLFSAVMPDYWDIPVIIKIIASRHPLGQQRIMLLDLLSSDWALEMLDAILEVKQHNLHMELQICQCSDFY
jgi:hypothetical protein